MQIAAQYALIVQEAITWARRISHCQSMRNWICNIMLCQLFLRIHLTDKTIIKLMQCSRRCGLAVQVEMKPLFLSPLLPPPKKLNRTQQVSAAELLTLTSTRQGHEQADSPHANQDDASLPQMCITPLRNLKFNGSVSDLWCIFANTSVVCCQWQQRVVVVERRECLFRSADDYCYNYIRTSARPLRVCKHHLQYTRPSLRARGTLKHSSIKHFVEWWLVLSKVDKRLLKVKASTA